MLNEITLQIPRVDITGSMGAVGTVSKLVINPFAKINAAHRSCEVVIKYGVQFFV